MRSLDMVWQRLVKDGQTWNRCGSTQQSVQKAVATLPAVLRPLGIEPVLDTVAIDEAAFKENTLESNRITMAGKPLEYWIGGKPEAVSAAQYVARTNAGQSKLTVVPMRQYHRSLSSRPGCERQQS